MKPLDVKWTDLQPSLHPVLQQAVAEGLGFTTVMPVQKATIPLLAKNYDVAVESCTGSGKTLAFLIPVFDHLLKKHFAKPGAPQKTVPEKHMRAIVISPTRELASQTAAVACRLSELITDVCGIKFPVMLTSGGGVQKCSDENLKPVILIATPGRLRELLFQKSDLDLTWSELEFLMLDEADRLIEGNHRLDLRDILTKLPKQRRTGLFSATLNNVKIEELMNLGLRNPAKVKLKTRVSEGSPQPALDPTKQNFAMPEGLQNAFIAFPGRFDKLIYVYGKLEELGAQKSIIFFNTCDSVEFYGKLFRATHPGLRIFRLHGKMEQKKRDKTFGLFSGEPRAILVATDIVARGIDFENVNNIVQVDAPQQPENFIHRIGRTARGMALGNSFYLAGPDELKFMRYLEEKGVAFAHKKKFGGNPDAGTSEAQLKAVMLTDRDFFVKAKRAFVSYLRSYKEHALKDIFDMAQVDIYDATRSFLLPIVPKLKEFTTDPGRRVLDEEYLAKSETAAFADPNQAKQFEAKEEVLLAKREQMEAEKETKRAKALKEAGKKKHRSHTDRQRSKINQQNIEDEEMAYEAGLLRRLRRGLISQEEFERKMDNLDDKVLRELED